MLHKIFKKFKLFGKVKLKTFGKVKLKIVGNDYKKIFNRLTENKIKVYSFIEQDNCAFIKIKVDEYKKHKNLFCDFKNEIVWSSITVNFFKKLFFRAGLFIGAIFVILNLIILSNITININISGNNIINKHEIISALNNFGIQKYKVNNFNNVELENYLIDKIKTISMVSISKKGSVLNIVIKEKQDANNISFLPYYANENMFITEISVTSGTPNCKVNSYVSKGDILIYPYIIDGNNNKIMCEPKGSIGAQVYYCNSKFFPNTLEIKKRTNKVIINSSFKLNNFTFLMTKHKNTFINFEEKTTKQLLFNNLFIPITVCKTYYYETKIEKQNEDFEKNLEKYKNEVLIIAKNKIPIFATEKNTILNIVNFESGKKIDVAILTEVKINI